MPSWAYYDCGTGGWWTATAAAISTTWTASHLTSSTSSLTASYVTYDRDRAVQPSATSWQQASYIATAEDLAAAERLRTRPHRLAPTQDAPQVLAARRTARESAEAKAEALLLRHLTPEQQQTYRHYGWFEVDVGGRIYRIENGYAGNITRRDPVTRRRVRRYCAHIAPSLPMQDNLLAQLFALTNNEEDFLRVANSS